MTSQWLSNKNKTYDKGLELYHRYYGKDKTYEFLLAHDNPAHGTLPFNMLINKIENAFRIWGNKEAIENTPNMPQNSIKVKEVDLSREGKNSQKNASGESNNGKLRLDFNKRVNISELPQDLRNKAIQNQSLYVEIQSLHAQMKEAVEDKSKRREIRSLLVEKFDLNRKNWNDIDNWWLKNKGKFLTSEPINTQIKFPDGSTIDEVIEEITIDAKKAVKLQQKINNLKANISRAKKEIPEMKKPHLKKAKQERIKEWEKVLKPLQDQYKVLTGESK